MNFIQIGGCDTVTNISYPFNPPVSHIAVVKCRLAEVRLVIQIHQENLDKRTPIYEEKLELYRRARFELRKVVHGINLGISFCTQERLENLITKQNTLHELVEMMRVNTNWMVLKVEHLKREEEELEKEVRKYKKSKPAKRVSWSFVEA